MQSTNSEIAIDVICPVFNHAEYIEECLLSILNQEGLIVIVHVVDDASNDATLEIVKVIQNKYPGQIKIYANKTRVGNAIESIALNKIRLTANYWAYIEGDDFLVNSKKFIMQISRLEEVPELIATATQCMLWKVEQNTKVILKPDLVRWNFKDLITKKNQYSMYCHISSLVWKSETRNNSEVFFPESSESEVYLVHLLLKNSKKYIEFQDIEGSCYRYTGKGIWSSLDEDRQKIVNYQVELAIDSITPIWFKIQRTMAPGIVKFRARITGRI